jgi:uncharacterized integral membrane protein (TIGR00698 family)
MSELAEKRTQRILRILPGLGLCIGICAAAIMLQVVQELLFRRSWVEPLVLALLLGACIRTFWPPGPRWRPGISFSAKTLLEVAIVLLGTALSFAMVWSAGIQLVGAIAVVVAAALAATYAIGRLFGLPRRMAVLIACGNAICGNSAIAATAPVIGAESNDVAAAIAFTAVLGVAVVLGLPLLIPALGLSERQFGTLAGLTVYAVPQVLAATAPAGAVALQVGTLVKLLRVLMLGPMILVISLLASRVADMGPHGESPEGARGKASARRLPRSGQILPWFVLGFLAMACLRSLDLIPAAALQLAATTSMLLATLAMAALGLGVDARALARAGPRVTASVTLSLAALGLISFAAVTCLGLVD